MEECSSWRFGCVNKETLECTCFV